MTHHPKKQKPLYQRQVGNLNSYPMFHANIIYFLMVAWNTHIIIFGWREHILMGIS
jgi:hypothetical protein